MFHHNPTSWSERSGRSQIGISERTASAAHIEAATAGSPRNLPWGVGGKMTHFAVTAANEM
jgi:hypothetical protein